MIGEFSAFRSRLEAHPMLSGHVDTSIRLSNGSPVRANYVVVYPSVPDRLNDDRHMAPQRVVSKATFTYDVRVVTTAADGVLLWAEAVTSQLVGYSLVVPGRKCDPIRMVDGVEEGRVEYDRSANLFYLDFSFRFVSRPGDPDDS